MKKSKWVQAINVSSDDYLLVSLVGKIIDFCFCILSASVNSGFLRVFPFDRLKISTIFRFRVRIHDLFLFSPLIA